MVITIVETAMVVTIVETTMVMTIIETTMVITIVDTTMVITTVEQCFWDCPWTEHLEMYSPIDQKTAVRCKTQSFLNKKTQNILLHP